MSAWFAVFRRDTGTLVSTGTVVAPDLPPGLEAAPITPESMAAFAWNPASRRFDAPISKPARIPTKAFMKLFTQAERARIEALRRTNDDLAAFMSLLLSDPTTDRAEPEVGQGLALLLQLRVLADQARVDAIRYG